MRSLLFGSGASKPKENKVENKYPVNPVYPIEIYRALERDGYCVIPDAVPRNLIDDAMRVINRSLGKHPPIREKMCPGCESSPEVLALYNKSKVREVMDMLLGEATQAFGGQIALRFPGDNTGDNFQISPHWSDSWHIDGLAHNGASSVAYGDIDNFTALVGVVLQDATQDFMGNLMVFPSSHYELEDYFRTHGFSSVLNAGVDGLPKFKFRRGVDQVRCRAGDCVIVNYLSAHSIAPNISPYIRYCIYFRITSREGQQEKQRTGKKHRPVSMLDCWHDWKGLRQVLAENPIHSNVNMSYGAPSSQTVFSGYMNGSPQNIGNDIVDEDAQLALALERSKFDM